MSPNLFDAHCHLNLPEFSADWKEVLEHTLAEGCWLVNVGADLESSRVAVTQAETKTEGVWAAVGFHPADSGVLTELSWQTLETLARQPKVVAIGECGLEFYQFSPEQPLKITPVEQKNIFRRQVELALAVNKPLMIHCRPSKGTMDAYEETLAILAEYKQQTGERLRGNFHFFAGDLAIAQKCLALGFTLSFTGVITFATQYNEVIKNVPLDKILAETDSPFVAPASYRGKRCEPLYVSEVVKKIAELKNLPYEKTAEITVENARRLFDV